MSSRSLILETIFLRARLPVLLLWPPAFVVRTYNAPKTGQSAEDLQDLTLTSGSKTRNCPKKDLLANLDPKKDSSPTQLKLAIVVCHERTLVLVPLQPDYLVSMTTMAGCVEAQKITTKHGGDVRSEKRCPTVTKPPLLGNIVSRCTSSASGKLGRGLVQTNR